MNVEATQAVYRGEVKPADEARARPGDPEIIGRAKVNLERLVVRNRHELDGARSVPIEQIGQDIESQMAARGEPAALLGEKSRIVEEKRITLEFVVGPLV